MGNNFLFKSLFLGSVISIYSYGAINGLVYKDFNFNGKYDDGDAPVIGAKIKATCSDGKVINILTNKQGKYTIKGMTKGSKCRIEADVKSSGLGDGSNAKGSSPLVDIVMDGETHNIIAGSPATYCQNNPDIVYVGTPGYYQSGNNNNGVHTGGGDASPDNFGTIFKVPTPAIGSSNPNNTIPSKRVLLTTHAQTGAVWGLAYKKGSKNLYAGASIKRFVPLKDESSIEKVKESLGRIWNLKLKKDGTLDSLNSFVIVPDVISDDLAKKLTKRDYGVNKDNDVKELIGKIGLGDIDINEAETKLYTINLFKKKLVKIDIASKNISQVDIPNPYSNGECENDKVRPWAVKVRGEDVYIGSVCEDKIESGVGAAIQKYSNGSFSTVAITNTLTYKRPAHYGPKNSGPIYYGNWGSGKDAPMLTDIEFTNKGDLVLGYTNRSAYNRRQALGGDIRKMCINPDGSYTDESSDKVQTDCATHKLTYGSNDYFEFYTGDYYGSNHGESGHPDTASGALAQAPGAPNIIVGMVDGTDWWQPGAIGLYSNTTGDKIGAQAAIDNTITNDTNSNGGSERKPYAGKQGGMGDVELLCDPSPIEIGDYVWMDINQNGIQDPNEPPFKNVKVKLACKENGNFVDYGTATTDEKGHFYFGGKDNVNLLSNKKLNPDMDCKLSINKSDVNGKDATIANVNGDKNDAIDNDAVANGDVNEIEFKTNLANNHNLDFGILPALGCISGVIFEDINNNKTLDSTDHVAPKGIKIKAIDAFGNIYETNTDANGTYSFDPIVVGKTKVQVDTTDADIPDGAVFDNYKFEIDVKESKQCEDVKVPYILPSPKDQDPKDIATCAKPTSLTWEGSNVSTSTKWQGMLQNKLSVTTDGGDSVDVTMSVEDTNGKFYDTDSANHSGSGTASAFGEPYLTMYLGNQDKPGDGDYLNSDNAGCQAHGYYLKSGEQAKLVVEFSEEVILDNWRIRDVDSGDMRGKESNWHWQDGIKVEAFDKDNNPVEVEAKIGDSGKGLIKDSNNIIHTDKDNYDAGEGSFDKGVGTSPNATNGHIVLTSNFKPIKKLIITHLAGPDMPCQTRSALVLSGFAVCKPLVISGNVYDDEDGVKESKSCSVNDENSVGGKLISKVDGKDINACLLNKDGIVLDTMKLDNGHYEFNKFIKPNSSYQVVITTNSCKVGEAAPKATLAKDWNFEGEKIKPSSCGHDGKKDGKIKVDVKDSNVEEVDFAINKRPKACNYKRKDSLNPHVLGNDNGVEFIDDMNKLKADCLSDNEEEKAKRIKIESISGCSIKYMDKKIKASDLVGDGVSDIDFSQFIINPEFGEVKCIMTYKSVDKAGRESDLATFEAPFSSIEISGNLFKDLTRDGKVNGKKVSKSCDDATNLYAVLLDNNDTVLSSMQIDNDGSYVFRDSDGVKANSKYKVVLTKNSYNVGDTSVKAQLTPGCIYADGENIESKTPETTDKKADGILNVDVGIESVREANFAISPLVKIGNLVWIEDDNDGDATTGNIETPKNIKVEVSCNNGQYHMNTVTDDNGHYQLLVPVDSKCIVKVEKPEFTTSTKGSDDSSVEDNSEDNKTHNPKGTTLTVGTSDNLGVDFGFLKTGCLGSIVWKDENVNGILDKGEPRLKDIKVTLLDKDGNIAKDADGNTIKTIKTNDNGEWKFCNLMPGEYRVKFESDRYISTKNNEDKDKGSDLGSYQRDGVTKPVKVESGNQNNYAVVYSGFIEEICLGDYVWNDTNLNGIEDKDEPGVVGLKVSIYDKNKQEVTDIFGKKVLPVKTDAQGHYKFCHLEPSKDYYIKVEIPKSYKTTIKDNDNKADKDGWIFVKSPVKNDYTLDTGIICECDEYKIRPEKKKELSAAALNITALLSLFILTLIFARREIEE